MNSTPDNNPFRSLMISDLNEADRPRERALQDGIGALQDHELLAIILGGGMPGLSVIDMSKNMLAESGGSLVTLARMHIPEMMRKFKGVGPAKAVSISAAFELGRRFEKEMKSLRAGSTPTVTSSEVVYEYMRSHLEILDYEEFWVLFLSRSNRIKGRRCISQGGTVSTVVDIKLIMRHAVDALADGIIAVHNHPSGTLRPSLQDDTLTRRIAEATKVLDIRLLDHIIISSDGYYSYKDNGKL